MAPDTLFFHKALKVSTTSLLGYQDVQTRRPGRLPHRNRSLPCPFH